jgi:hypothetical protein
MYCILNQGHVRELNSLLTFSEENIKDGETLILALPPKLFFSNIQKGPDISVKTF